MCCHHWVIEGAGGVQHGRCRVCGTERDFYPFATEDGRRASEQQKAALGKARVASAKARRKVV